MYPKELKYTEEHIWLKPEDAGAVRIGITDYYQRQLNSIVFIELPEIDTDLKKGETLGSIESAKTISDLQSPLNGKVVTVNSVLNTNPALANSDPYGAGWLAVLKISDSAEFDSLMSSEEYESFINMQPKENT